MTGGLIASIMARFLSEGVSTEVIHSVTKQLCPPNALSDAVDLYRAEAVLIASLAVGADIKNLRQVLGYDHAFISLVETNLRAHQLWVGSEVRFHWENSIDVLNDASIALYAMSAWDLTGRAP
jgi:hypothetical protein